MTTALPKLHPNDELIQWNPASQKWQNPGNDYLCYEIQAGGKWRVSARYGFDGTEADNGGQKVGEYEFDTQHEAMQFFVNFLFDRQMKFMQPARRAA